ncbi:glycosyltransferase family 4 protein [Haloarchaeobius sp. TZWSO28]|uniref:glycosyltransferase family 4 protein n=1 Tax=Haloarchaeobius sp. TZWSO28 TaxID=3446119 RepID=UPI003EB6D287
MHVCMVLRKPFPRDVRVEKEAHALLAAGHDVTLLCRGEEDRPARETHDGIEVCRVSETDLDPLHRQRLSLGYLVTTVHRFWADALRSIHAQRAIDVIHVHDLPLVPTGLSVGAETGSRVVADLHENYPEAIRQWRRMHAPSDVVTNVGLLSKYLALPVRRWKRIERRAVRDADHVLTVCQEGRTHYLEDCGAPASRVSVVGNTVEVDRDWFDPDAPPVEGYEDEFVVSYVGKYAPHRGLEAVVEGFAELLETVPEARLLLVGAPGNERYGERFHAHCERQGVLDRTTFTGWVDFERVPNYMAASDVCLVPHADTPHTNTTVPHKLFQYMAMGKPVLVSDVPPLKRIVGGTGSGLVAEAGNPEAMAGALRRLASDEGLRSRLGQNGRAAVDGRFNWSRDAETLVGVYECI